MPNRESAKKSNGLISDRAFWVGLVIYAVLIFAGARAFAANGPDNGASLGQRAKSTEALIADVPSKSAAARDLGLNLVPPNASIFRPATILETVPSSAWLIVAMAVGAIAWIQRLRVRQLFAGTRKRRVIYLAGPVLVVVLNASALADEGFSRTGNLDPGSAVLPASDNVIDRMTDSLGYDINLEQFTASDRLLATQPPGQEANVNLRRNMRMMVSGAPGATVTLSLSNFQMTDSSTFTLVGSASTYFVINVSRQFSLAGRSQIVLADGVQWDHVTFNVLGTGSMVTFSGRARLAGVLNAPERVVNMRNQSVVWGKVNAAKLVCRDSSKVVHPPVISPEQPPPETVITFSKLLSYFDPK